MTNPRTKISDKAQLTTEHYINNAIVMPVEGYTWAQAMRDAKYAESTIDKNSADIWGLAGVQSQIEQAMAKSRIDAEIKLDEVVANARYLVEMGKTVKNGADIGKGNEQLGKIIGAFRDIGINLNTDIPTDPVLYKQWLKTELARVEGNVQVIDSYDKSTAAIAQRY